MPGDQGILNYVLNQKAVLDGLRVERRKIMRWPGHGMDGVTAASRDQAQAPAVDRPLGRHQDRASRARCQGADVLSLFERQYYAKIPRAFFYAGSGRAGIFLQPLCAVASTRARLLLRRLRSMPDQAALASNAEVTRKPKPEV